MTNYMNRRVALSGFAAAGAMLVAPHAAGASSEDAEIFTALDRLNELSAVQRTAHDRLCALGAAHYPSREALPALTARAGDHAIFKTRKAEGELLDANDVEAARRVVRAFQHTGIEGDSALFGPAYARASQVCQAEDDWRRQRDAACKRAGIDEAQDAFDEAVSASYEAATAMLELRPRTIAGLRAIIVALNQVNYFDSLIDASALGELLTKSPALSTEA